jgi:hypothetical protein
VIILLGRHGAAASADLLDGHGRLRRDRDRGNGQERCNKADGHIEETLVRRHGFRPKLRKWGSRALGTHPTADQLPGQPGECGEPSNLGRDDHGGKEGKSKCLARVHMGAI